MDHKKIKRPRSMILDMIRRNMNTVGTIMGAIVGTLVTYDYVSTKCNKSYFKKSYEEEANLRYKYQEYVLDKKLDPIEEQKLKRHMNPDQIKDYDQEKRRRDRPCWDCERFEPMPDFSLLPTSFDSACYDGDLEKAIEIIVDLKNDPKLINKLNRGLDYALRGIRGTINEFKDTLNNYQVSEMLINHGAVYDRSNKGLNEYLDNKKAVKKILGDCLPSDIERLISKY